MRLRRMQTKTPDFLLAELHDIGFVRGVLKGDTDTEFVVDAGGAKVKLPRGASDASLAPYHVERSVLFVRERFGKSPVIEDDGHVVAESGAIIEYILRKYEGSASTACK